MQDLSLFSTRTISPNLNYISIMLCRSLSESSDHLWHSAELESVANPDLKNLKHLQNQGNVLLTEVCIWRYTVLPQNILVPYLLFFETTSLPSRTQSGASDLLFMRDSHNYFLPTDYIFSHQQMHGLLSHHLNKYYMCIRKLHNQKLK